MNPRLASLLAATLLALAVAVLPVPAGDLAAPSADPAAAPAVCQAAPDAAAPQPALGWQPETTAQPAAANCSQTCDQLCAPLQGRCKAGSCFCLRDPL